jgi:hypothetical protein
MTPDRVNGGSVVAQPALGLVATTLIIALALAYLALFDFATFIGPVAFFMLCLIPAQVVLVVLAPNPPFAARLQQPVKGIVLILATVVVAIVATPLALQLTGEGISPPGPIPSHYAVIVVPTAFFLAIAFGGWPFSLLTRNAGVVAGLALVASYALTYAVFRGFFNYDFLEGTPVHLASAPQGPYNAELALVFYVTALAGMFLLLHFDLWPLTTSPGLMKQPILAVIWLAASFAVAGLVMYVAAGQMGLRPMYVLTRITAPFIFGTIIVLNMLQNSLFVRLAQPAKGVANAATAAVIGVGLAQLYGAASNAIVGAFPPDVPDAYELWLVNALLSVTFPFLIFYAAFLNYWPLARPAAAPAEPART